MQWQRNKRVRYRYDEQTFSISLLPSVSRILILLVLYTVIGVAVVGSLGEPAPRKDDGPLAYILFGLFVLWPWFNDLAKWLPVTVHRDGSLRRLLKRANAPPARMMVYYCPGAKFTSLGISYPNGNGGRRKFELKEADAGCEEMAEVGQKLAAWLGVRYKVSSH